MSDRSYRQLAIQDVAAYLVDNPGRHVADLLDLVGGLEPTRERVFRDIDIERTRQEKLHTGHTGRSLMKDCLRRGSAYEAFAVLSEEVGEVAKVILENACVKDLRTELVQVAAVAVAMLEGLSE